MVGRIYFKKEGYRIAQIGLQMIFHLAFYLGHLGLEARFLVAGMNLV